MSALQIQLDDMFRKPLENRELNSFVTSWMQVIYMFLFEECYNSMYNVMSLDTMCPKCLDTLYCMLECHARISDMHSISYQS